MPFHSRKLLNKNERLINRIFTEVDYLSMLIATVSQVLENKNTLNNPILYFWYMKATMLKYDDPLSWLAFRKMPGTPMKQKSRSLTARAIRPAMEQ